VGVFETPLLGDFDSNGTLDAADYALWRANFGLTAELAADGNGDGIVDAADYVIWRNDLPVAARASAALVPEPSADVLLLVGTIVILARRRSWNSSKITSAFCKNWLRDIYEQK
jgi:hypothetical protein